MKRRKFRVVSLFGLPICNVGMEQTLASIQSRIASGGQYQIATANLDFVRNARQDPSLHRVICDCAMVLPDGFPLVWASRLMQRPLAQRVTGSDLTIELARLSAQRGYTIFLLGSNDADAQGAMRILAERFPGVRFVGQYAPAPAPLDRMDNAGILARIHEAQPDILLVAFGNPKQEFWIHRNLRALRVPISIGIGGTLEMINGSRVRAPRWVQTLNLEWAFRMMQEPMRLLPRYTSDLAALVRYFPREIIAHRLQWKRNREGAIHVEQQKGHRVIELRGTFSGMLCGEIRDITTEAIGAGEDITIDLSEVQRMDADGLGCLMDTRRSLHSRGLQLYLAGPSESLQRIFDASSLQTLLNREADTAAHEEEESRDTPSFSDHLSPPTAVFAESSFAGSQPLAAMSLMPTPIAADAMFVSEPAILAESQNLANSFANPEDLR